MVSSFICSVSRFFVRSNDLYLINCFCYFKLILFGFVFEMNWYLSSSSKWFALLFSKKNERSTQFDIKSLIFIIFMYHTTVYECYGELYVIDFYDTFYFGLSFFFHIFFSFGGESFGVYNGSMMVLGFSLDPRQWFEWDNREKVSTNIQ